MKPKPKPKPPPRYEWRVQYRRRSWEYLHPKFFQSLPAAWRLVERLRGAPPNGLPPVTELRVQRREVGEWTYVHWRDMEEQAVNYQRRGHHTGRAG